MPSAYYTAPDSRNYTLGACRVWFALGTYPDASAPTYGAYVDLGNAPTCDVNFDITELDHYLAVKGADHPDGVTIDSLDVSLSLTLDELSEENMSYMMMSAASATHQLFPGTRPKVRGKLLLRGVSDTGAEWEWSITDASISPNGSFSMNDQGWTTLPMRVVLNPASGSAPLGTFLYSGVGADLSDAPNPIGGVAAGIATASAIITATAYLTAAAAGVATVSGSVLGRGGMIGTSVGVGSESVTLGGRGALAGTVSVSIPAPTGAIKGVGRLVGTAAGVGTVTPAVIDGPLYLAGTAAGTSTASAVRSASAMLTATSSGAATTAANIRNAIFPISASVTAGATTAGSLRTALQPISGTSNGLTTRVEGALLGFGAMAGQANGVATVPAAQLDGV